MFLFGRWPGSRPFSLATMAMTYTSSVAVPSLASAEEELYAHILHLDIYVFVQSWCRLLFQKKMPPLPERLKQALLFKAWVVLTILAVTDITPSAKNCIQETDQLTWPEIHCRCCTGLTPMYRLYLPGSHR